MGTMLDNQLLFMQALIEKIDLKFTNMKSDMRKRYSDFIKMKSGKKDQDNVHTDNG